MKRKIIAWNNGVLHCQGSKRGKKHYTRCDNKSIHANVINKIDATSHLGFDLSSIIYRFLDTSATFLEQNGIDVLILRDRVIADADLDLDYITNHVPDKTALDTIFESQDFSLQQRNFIYGFVIGRAIACQDNWNKFTMLFGGSRVGKGLILNLVQDIVGIHNVVISSASSTSLPKFPKHSVWMCLEVSKCCVTTPENLQAALFNGKSRPELLYFCDNQIPKHWENNKFINETMLCIPFTKKVFSRDTSLRSRIKNDYAAIVAKSLACYYDLLMTYGTESIDLGIPFVHYAMSSEKVLIKVKTEPY